MRARFVFARPSPLRGSGTLQVLFLLLGLSALS
jgi:hypothetical protein